MEPIANRCLLKKNIEQVLFYLTCWFKLFPFCNWIRPWISGHLVSIQWSWLGWSDQFKIFLEEMIEFTCYLQEIFGENVNRSRIPGNQLKTEPRLTPIFRLLLWLKVHNVSSENLILDQQKKSPNWYFSSSSLLVCIIFSRCCKEKFCLGHIWEFNG